MNITLKLWDHAANRPNRADRRTLESVLARDPHHPGANHTMFTRSKRRSPEKAVASLID